MSASLVGSEMCIRDSATAALRLQLLNVAIGPVLLWASESVRPTLAHLRHLLRLERSMQRMVYRLPRMPGEDVW
eukprot:11950303-Alexandrium_andersonii.AAC.1